MSATALRDGKGVAALRKELDDSNLLAEAEAICREHRVTLDGVLSGKRSKALATARRAICVALRKYELSYPEIGRLVGLDHTSVRDAVLRSDARSKV